MQRKERGLPSIHIKRAKNEYRALKKAELEGFTWHGLRHTWASWHVINGTPLRVLMDLGGWADYDSVLRYAHLAPGHVAQYANNAKAPS